MSVFSSYQEINLYLRQNKNKRSFKFCFSEGFLTSTFLIANLDAKGEQNNQADDQNINDKNRCRQNLQPSINVRNKNTNVRTSI